MNNNDSKQSIQKSITVNSFKTYKKLEEINRNMRQENKTSSNNNFMVYSSCAKNMLKANTKNCINKINILK